LEQRQFSEEKLPMFEVRSLAVHDCLDPRTELLPRFRVGAHSSHLSAIQFSKADSDDTYFFLATEIPLRLLTRGDRVSTSSAELRQQKLSESFTGSIQPGFNSL
jgi:hypothetical protein